MGCGNTKIKEFFGTYKENETPNTPIGESKILRSINLRDNDCLIDRARTQKDCETLIDILETTKNRNIENPFLGTRQKNADGTLGKYKWKTFGEVFKEIENCARGYLTLNLLEISVCEEQEFKFIGIYAKNREEYIVAEMAGYLLGATVVPLYDILGVEGLQFIAQQTQLKILFTTAEELRKIWKMENSGILHMLTNIIIFDAISPQFETEICKKFPKLSIIPYIMVVRAGNSSEIRLKKEDRAKGETIGLLSYTSGTTGLPKGVMLSHRNMVAGTAGLANVEANKCTNSDINISYLPLAHVYERLILTSGLNYGTKIGFFGGDMKKLTDDLTALRPTIFHSVPILFKSFYSSIKQKLGALKGFKKKICEKALKVKLERVRKTAVCTHSLYDKLIFNKTKSILGGEARIICSGGAPNDKKVLEFLKVCFCCNISEGYGQTETFGTGGASSIEDPLTGHAGAPYVSMEYKLVDVPDMEYFVTDKEMWEGVETSIPRGELLMRSPAVFQGYFLNKQKTLQTIQGGWLYTGDIAKFLPGGRMKIIDRKSNYFKLSQGEYIVAEKLERVYARSIYVSQIFIYGDSMRDFVVGIIVVDKSYILKRAKELGLEENMESLIENDIIKKEIQDNLDLLAIEKKFNRLEYLKKIKLILEPFSVENNILTPTFKIKRVQAKKTFLSYLDEMYAGTDVFSMNMSPPEKHKIVNIAKVFPVPLSSRHLVTDK